MVAFWEAAARARGGGTQRVGVYNTRVGVSNTRVGMYKKGWLQRLADNFTESVNHRNPHGPLRNDPVVRWDGQIPC